MVFNKWIEYTPRVLGCTVMESFLSISYLEWARNYFTHALHFVKRSPNGPFRYDVRTLVDFTKKESTCWTWDKLMLAVTHKSPLFFGKHCKSPLKITESSSTWLADGTHSHLLMSYPLPHKPAPLMFFHQTSLLA